MVLGIVVIVAEVFVVVVNFYSVLVHDDIIKVFVVVLVIFRHCTCNHI